MADLIIHLFFLVLAPLLILLSIIFFSFIEIPDFTLTSIPFKLNEQFQNFFHSEFEFIYIYFIKIKTLFKTICLEITVEQCNNSNLLFKFKLCNVLCTNIFRKILIYCITIIINIFPSFIFHSTYLYV